MISRTSKKESKFASCKDHNACVKNADRQFASIFKAGARSGLKFNYSGITIAPPKTSWQEALNNAETYAYAIYITFTQKKKESNHLLTFIPTETPRGTYIIEGRERLRSGKLITDDKEDSSRNLEKYRVKIATIYPAVERYFDRIIEGIQTQQNQAIFAEAPETITGGAAALIQQIFNCKYGIENYPFLDSTNPLSEVSHRRKLSFYGSSHSKKGRDIHPSHYGRLCVVETPESEKIGMRVHLAHKAIIDERTGQILTPIMNIKTNRIINTPTKNDMIISDKVTKLIGRVPVRGDDDGMYVTAADVKYTDAYVDQLFGFAALQVPFIHHNDTARSLMGAKNLKQAIPINFAEKPLVVTGYEQEVAGLSGRLVRADSAGIVESVQPEGIIVKSRTGKRITYPLMHDVMSVASKAVVCQIPTVKQGDQVKKDAIMAEGAGIKDGELALGLNCLVAYMPYFGFNMDDGIVVSSRLTPLMSSTHIEEFTFRLKPGEIPTWAAPEGLSIQRNTALFKTRLKSEEKIHSAQDRMIGGTVRRIELVPGLVEIQVKKEFPLETGDKLMGRHGNKGIVAKILPKNEMPYFEIANHEGGKTRKYVDLLLNPHSVISRMNLGQIFETHFGWIANEHPDEKVRNDARTSGSPFHTVDLKNLATWLRESGLDEKGRARVHIHDSDQDRLTDHPVTIGYQYMVKLNHLAASKLSARGERGAVSSITGLPLSGKKRGGGQRIGEMESWALLGHGADNILKEFFSEKANAHKLDTGAVSVSDSLKVLVYLLRGLGLCLEFYDEQDKAIEPEDFSATKRSTLKKYRVYWADKHKTTSWGKYLFQPKKTDLERVKDYLERKVEEREIRPGARNIENLNEFISAYKDETAYIDLRAEVMLCGKPLSYLPVIPTLCRPLPEDALNKYYKKIFILNEVLKKMSSEDPDYLKKVQSLQTIIDTKLVPEILKRVNGKKGIIRKAVVGKRINSSGRAVIVPNPRLRADEIELPSRIMSALGLSSGDVVLMNRQPSLHIHNIQAFSAREGRNNAIGIHPLVCSGFNADFDGDTMAVYRVDSGIPPMMMAGKQLLLAANGKVNINLSQDIVSGIYYATGTEAGKEELRKIFSDFGMDVNIDARITKNKINQLMEQYLLKHDPESPMGLAESIARFGLAWATRSGLTFNIFDLYELDRKEPTVSASHVRQASEEDLLKQRVLDAKENPISDMVTSGARGDIKQLNQMAGNKGFVDRLGGKRTSLPITSNYLRGLSPVEYYLACFGARNSLGDKKLLTPDCGYLTRRLIYSASEVCVTEEDCGTSEGVVLSVDRAYGRTMAEDLLVDHTVVIEKNTLLTIGAIETVRKFKITEIKVRSPLTCCASKGICGKCYGMDLARKAESAIGFRAGIIAAQVIGERATQDAMRTYHLGTATGAVKIFDKVKDIFDNVDERGASSKTKISDRIKNKGELLSLAQELAKYYENKVDLKHYEVLIKALSENDQYVGAKASIGNKTVLQRASYERAFSVFAEAAERSDMQDIQGDFDKLFI